MGSLLISLAAETLDVREFLPQLQYCEKRGLRLAWQRDGMVGYLDCGTIANALELYNTHETMRQRGRIIELPAAAYTVTWNQCSNVQCESDRR